MLPDGAGGLFLIGDKSIFRLDRERKVAPFASAFKDLTAGAVALGRDGSLYVTDGPLVTRVGRDGEITRLAELKDPFGLCLDGSGAVYVADLSTHAIYRLREGKAEKLAGSGRPGHKDGPAAEAEFFAPSGLAFDRHGALYVKESGRHEPFPAPLRIRKIAPDGRVSTLAAIDPE